MTNRQTLSPQEDAILRSLYLNRMSTGELLFEELRDRADATKGQAQKGLAKEYRGSMVYVYIRRLLKDKILRAPSSDYRIRTVALAPRAVPYLPDVNQALLKNRTLAKLRDVRHHLTTTLLTTTLRKATHQDSNYSFTIDRDGEEPRIEAEGHNAKLLDKLITLKSPTVAGHYFVETDMGTADVRGSVGRALEAKIKLFWAFHKQKGPQKFGLPGAKLLFWVSTEKRAQEIRDLIFGPDPGKESERLKHNFTKPRTGLNLPDTNVFKVRFADKGFLFDPLALPQLLLKDI